MKEVGFLPGGPLGPGKPELGCVLRYWMRDYGSGEMLKKYDLSFDFLVMNCAKFVKKVE